MKYSILNIYENESENTENFRKKEKRTNIWAKHGGKVVLFIRFIQEVLQIATETVSVIWMVLPHIWITVSYTHLDVYKRQKEAYDVASQI